MIQMHSGSFEKCILSLIMFYFRCAKLIKVSRFQPKSNLLHHQLYPIGMETIAYISPIHKSEAKSNVPSYRQICI